MNLKDRVETAIYESLGQDVTTNFYAREVMDVVFSELAKIECEAAES